MELFLQEWLFFDKNGHKKRTGDYTAFVCPQLSVFSNLKTAGKVAEARRRIVSKRTFRGGVDKE